MFRCSGTQVVYICVYLQMQMTPSPLPVRSRTKTVILNVTVLVWTAFPSFLSAHSHTKTTPLPRLPLTLRPPTPLPSLLGVPGGPWGFWWLLASLGFAWGHWGTRDLWADRPGHLGGEFLAYFEYLWANSAARTVLWPDSFTWSKKL